jgi:hypothetical protein
MTEERDNVSLELLGARVLTLTAEVCDLQHRFTAMEHRLSGLEQRLIVRIAEPVDGQPSRGA